MTQQSRVRTVSTLGITQILAWGSSYYLPAVLAQPIAHGLGVSTPTVFGGFSAALVIAAILGPFAGRAIDRFGGRPVLMATNLIFSLGLCLLAIAQDTTGMLLAWLVIGIGMGGGLYEAAFSSLVRLYGSDSRAAITGVTLVAGLASTLAWPLSAWLEVQIGWRGACFTWAALHLLVALPLNWSLPKAKRVDEPSAEAANEAQTDTAPNKHPRKTSALLAMSFALIWFISTAMAAHLPGLLMLSGATLASAVAIGAMVGPAQVAGRLLEFTTLRHLHPLRSARVAVLLHPIAASALAIFGAPVAALFALLHGAGNGMLTIATGTLPLALFGSKGYGMRQGLLMSPARLFQALAPWLFGLWIEAWGLAAMWFSAGLGLAAFCTLLALGRAGPNDP